MFPSYKALHAGGMTYGPRSPASRRVTPAGIAAEAEVAIPDRVETRPAAVGPASVSAGRGLLWLADPGRAR